MDETSKALQDLYFQYTHLPLGGKGIACPYWMNDNKKGIFGPFGGKGTSSEIVQATHDEAKKFQVNLEELTEQEILNFMKEKRIGVDCSGFAFWMLNAFDLERGGNGIGDDIPGSQGNFIKARANVKMLTDPNVSESVELNQIKVGDMIRVKEGHHVMVVTGVSTDKEVQKIEYSHSSFGNGVHKEEFTIIDPQKSLEKQSWKESFLINCLSGDGIKRLKIFG